MANGALLVLGALGALALAATVAERNSTGCAQCGGRVGEGSFDRNDEARGTHLMRQRYRAKAGFVVSLKEIEALRPFHREVKEAAVARANAAMARGGVSGVAFKRLEAEQRKILDANGFGPLKGMVGHEVAKDVRSIVDYAEAKALARLRARWKRAEGKGAPRNASPPIPSPRSAEGRRMEADETRYASTLYAARAWTIFVCTKTGHLGSDARVGVYGDDNRTLFEGVTFQLVVPKAPSFPFPGKAVGAARPAVTSEGAAQMEAESAEIAAMLEEEGEKEEAALLKGLKGAPFLRMSRGGVPVGFYFVSDIGSLYGVNATQRIPLLTATSKMASPSFGIPAGRGADGGTCPGAAVESQDAVAQLGGKERRVCSVCYATGANYGYANNMTQQEGRRLWVKQLQASGAEVLGVNLACMIEAYARHTFHTHRAGQEIGVWNGREIVVPAGKNQRKPAWSTPLQISEVDGRPVPVDTQALFASRRVPVGSVTGFFRVHDSGDFGVGSLNTYIAGWAHAATLLPHVYFWAPSRIWVVRKKENQLDVAQRDWLEAGREAALYVGRDIVDTRPVVAVEGSANVHEVSVSTVAPAPGEAFAENQKEDEACRIVNVPGETRVALLRKLGTLPNFALRPSGLYIKRLESDPVTIPTVGGMVGSGVAAKLPGGRYPAMVDTGGVAAWQCPVYTAQADGKEAKSCQTANCRACWIAKDLPIFYGAH